MGVRQTSGTNLFSYCPTEAHSNLRDTGADSGIEKLARFSRHAKAAVPQGLGNILRGLAMVGQLKVMNNTGAVHRHCRQNSSLQQINDERREANFQRMRPHAEHERPLRPDCRRNSLNDRPQVGRCQGTRQRIEKVTHFPRGSPGDTQYTSRNLALALLEWIRHYPRGINWWKSHDSRLSAPKSTSSTISQMTCPIRIWVSCMRGVTAVADTQRRWSTMFTILPPLPPVRPIVRIPSSRQTSSARNTFAEFPLVEIAIAASLFRPKARTCLAKRSSTP